MVPTRRNVLPTVKQVGLVKWATKKNFEEVISNKHSGILQTSGRTRVCPFSCVGPDELISLKNKKTSQQQMKKANFLMLLRRC